MKFELTQKMATRTIVTTSEEPWSLIAEMLAALSPKGGMGNPRLSGAIGDIEIGIEDGPQVRLRIL